MDLTYTPAEEQFRSQAREWLESNSPELPMPPGDTAEGFPVHRAWERKLFEAGWAVVSWPKRYGGRDASLWEWLIFEEEYYRAGLPQRVAQNGIFLLAPTIFEFGTEEQKDRILPRMARTDDMWCQGWSEPNAGSDLAGISSYGRRDDKRGGWILNGQKTWTTRGAFCTHLFGLFRTDPETERHRGMTYLLVDLNSSGITVRSVDKLDGDAGFAEVFFDDVFVPDQDVLGDVGKGWNVAMATTGSERGLSLRSPGRFIALVDRLIDLYRKYEETGGPLDPTIRASVTESWMDAQAYKLATDMSVTRIAAGEPAGAESSLNKIFW
ncbi:MAG TPA: acyl-CoA dehydrogenase family protein, partial [Acidimicrobiales bacterium]|nr:acyl-CoA dehydrogenase family protein [Acidimicrobiales bacterium]